MLYHRWMMMTIGRMMKLSAITEITPTTSHHQRFFIIIINNIIIAIVILYVPYQSKSNVKKQKHRQRQLQRQILVCSLLLSIITINNTYIISLPSTTTTVTLGTPSTTIHCDNIHNINNTHNSYCVSLFVYLFLPS